MIPSSTTVRRGAGAAGRQPHRHRRRRPTAAAALTAGWLLATGCAGPSAPPERPLCIALYNDPLTLDPHRRNEILTFSVLRNLYEALTAFLFPTARHA